MKVIPRRWRLYLDTSVFGGCLDDAQGWNEDSLRVVDYIISKKADLITSDLLEKELSTAPAQVRKIYEAIPGESKRISSTNKEVDSLAEAYIRAGVVCRRWKADCLHVALATIAAADAIVSWNFKHIVRFDRIRGFNTVNLSEGRSLMQIVSPKEVNLDDN